MGTPLRTLCACQGSDLQQLYECLGWQRLLWLNPCVGELEANKTTRQAIKTFRFTVESQKDFHVKRLAELGLLVTTTTTQRTTQRVTQAMTTKTTTFVATIAPIRITIKESERLQTPAPPEIVRGKFSLQVNSDQQK